MFSCDLAHVRDEIATDRDGLVEIDETGVARGPFRATPSTRSPQPGRSRRRLVAQATTVPPGVEITLWFFLFIAMSAIGRSKLLELLLLLLLRLLSELVIVASEFWMAV